MTSGTRVVDVSTYPIDAQKICGFLSKYDKPAFAWQVRRACELDMKTFKANTELLMRDRVVWHYTSRGRGRKGYAINGVVLENVPQLTFRSVNPEEVLSEAMQSEPRMGLSHYSRVTGMPYRVARQTASGFILKGYAERVPVPFKRVYEWKGVKVFTHDLPVREPLLATGLRDEDA